ncbi:MAG: F-type H+-transporting ATPase subunit gamma [Parcubacteria group bacterium Gr01-1014_30]|nr:MAG: F-type H+-transporting ATPase subunit gamma [Parcubacteria group bacterium Gr01-1014_30]
MESLQNIKSRLRAVRNIGQITKAMEVVAATKMRKSQEIALRTRPYAFKALELLSKLSRFSPLETALTKKRQVKTTLLVVIASDRGLAGAFNTQVFRSAEKLFKADSVYAAVGKKAGKFILKKGLSLVSGFQGFGDFVRFEDIKPLADFVIDGFKSARWDRVVTVSMHFRTALKQEMVNQQVLPVDFEKIEETVKAIVPEHGKYAESLPTTNYKLQTAGIDYLFEPSAKETLEMLIPHLVKMQIYHLVLEANASEHSARRVAMKQASDNSDELFSAFTLQYNKARQEAITKETIEITSTIER